MKRTRLTIFIALALSAGTTSVCATTETDFQKLANEGIEKRFANADTFIKKLSDIEIALQNYHGANGNFTDLATLVSDGYYYGNFDTPYGTNANLTIVSSNNAVLEVEVEATVSDYIAGRTNGSVVAGNVVEIPIVALSTSSTGVASDSALLDGLDSSQFVRSDQYTAVSANTRWEDGSAVELGTDGAFSINRNSNVNTISTISGGLNVESYGNDDDISLSTTNTAGTRTTNLELKGTSENVVLRQAGINRLTTTALGIDINGITDITAGSDGVGVSITNSNPINEATLELRQDEFAHHLTTNFGSLRLESLLEGAVTNSFEIDITGTRYETTYGDFFNTSVDASEVQFNSNSGVYSFIGNLKADTFEAGPLLVTPTDALINGNSIYHAGNDGIGSGVDADLFDGLESSQFSRSDIVSLRSADLNFLDNIALNFGDDNDLSIYHDGSNNVITAQTGNIVVDMQSNGEVISTGDFRINNPSGISSLFFGDDTTSITSDKVYSGNRLVQLVEADDLSTSVKEIAFANSTHVTSSTTHQVAGGFLQNMNIANNALLQSDTIVDGGGGGRSGFTVQRISGGDTRVSLYAQENFELAAVTIVKSGDDSQLDSIITSSEIINLSSSQDSKSVVFNFVDDIYQINGDDIITTGNYETLLTNVDAETLDGIDSISFIRNDITTEQSLTGDLNINNASGTSTLSFGDGSAELVYRADTINSLSRSVIAPSGNDYFEIIRIDDSQSTFQNSVSNGTTFSGTESYSSGLSAGTELYSDATDYQSKIILESDDVRGNVTLVAQNGSTKKTSFNISYDSNRLFPSIIQSSSDVIRFQDIDDENNNVNFDFRANVFEINGDDIITTGNYETLLTNVDAETLDGIDSTSFIRNDITTEQSLTGDLNINNVSGTSTLSFGDGGTTVSSKALMRGRLYSTQVDSDTASVYASSSSLADGDYASIYDYTTNSLGSTESRISVSPGMLSAETRVFSSDGPSGLSTRYVDGSRAETSISAQHGGISTYINVRNNVDDSLADTINTNSEIVDIRSTLHSKDVIFNFMDDIYQINGDDIVTSGNIGMYAASAEDAVSKTQDSTLRAKYVVDGLEDDGTTASFASVDLINGANLFLSNSNYQQVGGTFRVFNGPTGFAIESGNLVAQQMNIQLQSPSGILALTTTQANMTGVNTFVSGDDKMVVGLNHEDGTVGKLSDSFLVFDRTRAALLHEEAINIETPHGSFAMLDGETITFSDARMTTIGTDDATLGLGSRGEDTINISNDRIRIDPLKTEISHTQQVDILTPNVVVIDPSDSAIPVLNLNKATFKYNGNDVITTANYETQLTNVDAQTLDGIDSTSFLRNDVATPQSLSGDLTVANMTIDDGTYNNYLTFSDIGATIGIDGSRFYRRLSSDEINGYFESINNSPQSAAQTQTVMRGSNYVEKISNVNTSSSESSLNTSTSLGEVLLEMKTNEISERSSLRMVASYDVLTATSIELVSQQNDPAESLVKVSSSVVNIENLSATKAITFDFLSDSYQINGSEIITSDNYNTHLINLDAQTLDGIDSTGFLRLNTAGVQTIETMVSFDDLTVFSDEMYIENGLIITGDSGLDSKIYFTNADGDERASISTDAIADRLKFTLGESRLDSFEISSGNLTLNTDTQTFNLLMLPNEVLYYSDTGRHVFDNEVDVAATFKVNDGATLEVSSTVFTYKGNDVYHAGNIPTKIDIGLGLVENYGISDDYNLDSSTSYASSKAVHDGIQYAIANAGGGGFTEELIVDSPTCGGTTAISTDLSAMKLIAIDMVNNVNYRTVITTPDTINQSIADIFIYVAEQDESMAAFRTFTDSEIEVSGCSSDTVIRKIVGYK